MFSIDKPLSPFPITITALFLHKLISQHFCSYYFQSQFYYFTSYILSGAELVVATTRPETMLADAAVAVHPADSRYSAFVGKQVMSVYNLNSQ